MNQVFRTRDLSSFLLEGEPRFRYNSAGSPVVKVKKKRSAEEYQLAHLRL